MLVLKAGLSSAEIIPVGNDINCYIKDWSSAFVRYDKTSYWSHIKISLLALSKQLKKIGNQKHNRGRTTDMLLKKCVRK